MTSTEQQDCRNELGRLLGRYTDHAKRLYAILKDENAALSATDPSALQAIISNKKTYVQQMENLETERRALCRRAGFSSDQTGMQELLDQCGDSIEIGAAWLDVLKIAQQSEQMNRINGAIGRVRHEQLMDALAVLKGSDMPQLVYGAQGQESARFKRSPLARA